MNKSCVRDTKKVSKKMVLLLLLTLSGISFVLLPMMSVYADGGGPAGYLWVDGVQVDFQFDVYPGTTHLIKVCDIPEIIDSGYVWIKVSDDASTWQKVAYDEDTDCTDEFEWVAPDDPFCTTYVVNYKDWDGDPDCVYVAMGLLSTTGHLHIIPEFALGTIMPIISTISGLVVYSKYRRR